MRSKSAMPSAFGAHAAGAVVRSLAVAGTPRFRRRERRRNVLRTSTSAVWQRPEAASSSAKPGVEDDGLARKLRRAARRACSCVARLADRPPVAIGDLVGADDERVGMRRRRRCRALASASRNAVAAGVSSGSAVSSVSGRDGDEGKPEPLEQHLPIARRRRQHERPRAAAPRRWTSGLAVVFADIFDRIARTRYYPTFFVGRRAQPQSRTERQAASGGRHGRAAEIGGTAPRGSFDAFEVAARGCDARGNGERR